jgi:hypothetical protein
VTPTQLTLGTGSVNESSLTKLEYDDLQVWLRHGRIGCGRGYQDEVEKAKKIEAEAKGSSVFNLTNSAA